MPSLRVEIDPALLTQLRALDKSERQKLGQLIEETRKNFGRPHLHQGTGLRVLGPGLYECRRGLHQRLVFSAHSQCLYFHFLGTHDEVRKFLRRL